MDSPDVNNCGRVCSVLNIAARGALCLSLAAVLVVVGSMFLDVRVYGLLAKQDEVQKDLDAMTTNWDVDYEFVPVSRERWETMRVDASKHGPKTRLVYLPFSFDDANETLSVIRREDWGRSLNPWASGLGGLWFNGAIGLALFGLVLYGAAVFVDRMARRPHSAV